MKLNRTPIKRTTVSAPGNGTAVEEAHESWISVRANRISCSPPGIQLFDSDVAHTSFVRVTIERVARTRDLSSDWMHSREKLAEIEMSHAQWGEFVSSFGDGSVRPATLTFFNGDLIPQPEDETSRVATSINELKSHATEAANGAKAALGAAVQAFESGAGRREMRKLLDEAQRLVEQLPGNLAFVAKKTAETVETVVAKATADIEATVRRHAMSLGMTTPEVDEFLALPGHRLLSEQPELESGQ